MEELINFHDFILSVDVLLNDKQTFFYQSDSYEWYCRYTGEYISTKEMLERLKDDLRHSNEGRYYVKWIFIPRGINRKN